MRRFVLCVIFVSAALGCVALTLHPAHLRAASAASRCGGVERWDVKTLSDLKGPNAPKLKRDAELRTIDYLVTREHEPIGRHTPRLADVERTKYVLKDVTLVEAKVEEDGDIHLVIRDDHGAPTDHMIVEFPNVTCNVTAPTSYRRSMSNARAAMEALIEQCRTRNVRGWAQLQGTATIRGVGFFDLPHPTPQHGVASNNVEIHPTLSIHGGC